MVACPWLLQGGEDAGLVTALSIGSRTSQNTTTGHSGATGPTGGSGAPAAGGAQASSKTA